MNTDKISNDIYPLVLSKRFVKILQKINDKVSSILLQFSKEKKKFKETYIDRTDKEDIVSFLPSDKVSSLGLDECWSDAQRIEIKIGRIINRLIGDMVTAQEIESFVNDYKAIIKTKRMYRNFKIVEGNDLKKWYLQANYADGGGNLGNSCMRYGFSQAFLELYTKNSDKIKLLILLDDTKEKILGRALLWYLDKPKNKILMDRVYFSNDFILNMFINMAIKNGWLYKLESMDNVMQVVSNNKIIRTTMSTKIKDIDYEFFPFVDNLGFYDPESNILTNDPKYLESLGCKEFYDLCDTTGGYEVRRDFDF